MRRIQNLMVRKKGKERENPNQEIQEAQQSAHQQSSVPQSGGSVLRDYESENRTMDENTRGVHVQGNSIGEPSIPRMEEQDSNYLTPYQESSIRSPVQYPLPPLRQSPNNVHSGGFFEKAQDVKITGGKFEETRGDRNVVIIQVGARSSKEEEYIISQQRQPIPVIPQASTSASVITSGNISERQEQAAFQVQLDQQHTPSVSITEYSPDNSNIIYERHLKLKKRGFPLWIPGPNMLLPKAYRRKGVDIGDIGIITPSGGFSFLFNICLPSNDPLGINPAVLPEGFAPIFPPIGLLDLRQFPQFAAGSYLASTHIERIYDNPPSPGLSFKTSAAEGAILTLPEGAIELDLQNVPRFEAYAMANVESWYRYANGPRGLRAKNGEIRLVIGCDKATSWGVAAVANLTQHKAHHLKYRPSEISGGQTSSVSPMRFYQWEYSGIAEARVGPDLREIEELNLRNDDSDSAPVDGKYWNQSLFLRTLNITLNEEIFNAINEEVKLALVQETQQFRNTGDSNDLTRISRKANAGSTQQSGAISEDQTSSGSKRPEPGTGSVQDVVSVIAIGTEHATMSISPSAPISHPADVLHKLILKKANALNIRAVVTQDKHWYSVITDDDQIMPNAVELAERVMAVHDIREVDGIVYLEAKDHPLAVKSCTENETLTDEGKQPSTGSTSKTYLHLPMSYKDSPTLRNDDSKSSPQWLPNVPNSNDENKMVELRLSQEQEPQDSRIINSRTNATSLYRSPLLSAFLAEIKLVGDLGVENSSSKRPHHFVIVFVDNKEIASSREKGRLLGPRGIWPINQEFLFYPSSMIKIVIYRASKTYIIKHVVAQRAVKLVDLLDNDTAFDLEGKTSASFAWKSKIILHLSLVPKHANVSQSYTRTVDNDVSHPINAVLTPGGNCTLRALDRALYLIKDIMDRAADTYPILQTSWTVLSAAYTAAHQAKFFDNNVQRLAEILRDVLDVAKERPDLLANEGTEKIGRISLRVASVIYEYTKLSLKFTGQAAKFPKSSDIELQIILCIHELHSIKADQLERESEIGNIQMALYHGNEAAVKLLLEYGADTGEFGNALQAASYQGHEGIVAMLLENGADANAQGGAFGTAIQAASYQGHEGIVAMLLKNGADANMRGGHISALQAASSQGHKAAVKPQLEYGADANTSGGEYSNALQVASYQGHDAVVKLLLEHGADLNDQGGEFGNALQAASYQGHEAVITMLLKNGADVNAQGGEFGTALQAASAVGNEAVVKLLLENGADVDVEKGWYGNALQAASYQGHDAVVKLLLEHGADVNARGGEYGNALQAASCWGNETIVMMLLANGADPNTRGGEYGNALQAASYQGHKGVVMMLLENGADANAQGGSFGNALQAASYQGHEEVVMLLLKNGAGPNAQGGEYDNALQAATIQGHEAVVKLLVEHGADRSI